MSLLTVWLMQALNTTQTPPEYKWGEEYVLILFGKKIRSIWGKVWQEVEKRVKLFVFNVDIACEEFEPFLIVVEYGRDET